MFTKINKEKQIGIGELIRWVEEKLEDKGMDEANIEAGYLVESLLDKKGAELYLSYNDRIDISYKDTLCLLIERRIRGEPIQYITGKCNFLDWTFFVGRGVFIPRPETEVLVKIAQSLSPPSPVIYDIGTGCGVIGISLAKLIPSAKVYASDIGDMKFARLNRKKLGVERTVHLLYGSLCEPYGEIKPADIIVSNPPYIPGKEIDSLQIEIKEYEPLKSLDGGADGLVFIRKLIPSAKSHLKENGLLIFEIGIGQLQGVKKIASKYFKTVEFEKDYYDKERVCICKSV